MVAARILPNVPDQWSATVAVTIADDAQSVAERTIVPMPDVRRLYAPTASLALGADAGVIDWGAHLRGTSTKSMVPRGRNLPITS